MDPPVSHDPDLLPILKYEQFYRILLSRYRICPACSYRIFGIMSPKLYSD